MVTRVAVTTGAPGTAAAFSPTLPSHQTGDRLDLVVTGKYNTTTVPTINQGWTLVGSGTGGTGSTGNDAGQTFWAAYAKDATSGAETAPTVTPGATAPNSWEWVCSSHRPGTGKVWKDTIAASAPWVRAASDTTTTSPLTETATDWGTGNYPTGGDAIFCVGVIPTDLGSALGTTTITNTGLSGGTVTAGGYVENSLGQDSAAVWGGWTGFTGTASAGCAMSFTVTGASNQSGSLVAMAFREQDVPLTTPAGLVAFNAGASASSQTTSSFTPRANTRIYAFLWSNFSSATSTISDSDSRTWTLETESNDGTIFNRTYLWSAAAGSSPSSMTVTFTHSATPYVGYALLDIDAALTVVQAASNAEGSGATTFSGTLAAAATSGNTVLVFHGNNDDNGSGVPESSGFTTVIYSGASGSTFEPVRGSYSTAFTGTTVNVAHDETGNGSGGAIIELEAGGGATTLTPTAISSAEAFGTAVISTTLTSTPTAIASAEAFGTPVANVQQTATATGIASAEVFGEPSLTVVVSSTPTGVVSNEAFGAPVLTTLVTLSPTSIQSALAFGFPSLLGIVTANPASISSVEVFGTPIIQTLLTSIPAGIESAFAAGTPLLTAILDTSPSSIGSAETFGSPNLTTLLNVISSSISSAEAFGEPFLSTLSMVVPSSIASAEIFGTTSILQNIPVIVTGITTAQAFGNPSVLPVLNTSLIGIPTAQAFGNPVINTGLTSVPNSIVSQLVFGLPTIETRLTASPNGIITGFAAGSPTAHYVSYMTAQSIASAEAFGQPSLSGVVALSPTGIVSGFVAGQPAATTVLLVSPDGIISLVSFGNPTLSGHVTITPIGILSEEQFGLVRINPLTDFVGWGIPIGIGL